MDYQAFIFVGGGKQLDPFSRTKGDTEHSIVKALLPIANRPMIEYMLDWCEQAAFSELTIVVDEEDEIALTEGLQPYFKKRSAAYETLLKNLKDNNESVNSSFFKKPIPIKIVSTKCKTSGEILYKELAPKITKDFVILPCDFITDLPPQILKYQFLNSPKNQVCMSIHYKTNFENVDKKQLGATYTIYNKTKFLDSYTKESVDKARYLKIRNQLLWRHSNVSASKKLLNSSMYFCKYEILAIFEELVHTKVDFFNNKPINKVFRDLARRSWQHAQEKDSVGMFIVPEEATMIRSNNLSTYLESNRYMLKLHQENGLTATAHGSHKTASGNSQTSGAVGADSLVGEKCALGDKSSIKKSVVGNNCKIGKKCRIVGSIIFDNVEIDDECHIENCIIGKNVKIEKKSKLTNCNVQSKYIVQEESMYKGETLKSIFVNEDEFGFDGSESGSGAENGIYSSGDGFSGSDDDENSDYTSSEAVVSDDDFDGDDFFDRS